MQSADKALSKLLMARNDGPEAAMKTKLQVDIKENSAGA